MTFFTYSPIQTLRIEILAVEVLGSLRRTVRPRGRGTYWSALKRGWNRRDDCRPATVCSGNIFARQALKFN